MPIGWGMAAMGALGFMGSREAGEAAESGQLGAARVQQEMHEESLAFQREMWDWQKEQAAPWTEAGLGALGQYQDVMKKGFAFRPEDDPV